MKSQDQRPVDCAAFKRSLFHFQADEIPETNRTPLEEHLADCQCCAGRLAFEDGMLSGVRKRLGAGEPPPGLETRVRASLRQASPAGATRGWFRAPLSVAAIAASLLLAVLLVPLGDATGLPTQASGEPYAGTVRVVDLDCHRAGKSLAQQRACRHEQHVNALQLPDGSIWNLSLAQERARRLALDRGMRGHQVEVSGQYYPRLQTLWVTRAADLGNQL